MARSRGAAVERLVAIRQVARRHVVQGVDLGCDVGHAAPFFQRPAREPAGRGATLRGRWPGSSRQDRPQSAGSPLARDVRSRLATMLRTSPRARMLAISSRRSSAVMLSGSRVESAGIGVAPWATRESHCHYGCPMPCAGAMRDAIATSAPSGTALPALPGLDLPESSRYDSDGEHRPQDRHPAEPATRRGST